MSTASTATPYIEAGSPEELNWYEPLPELAKARRRLELAIILDTDGGITWAGDPVRTIMAAIGFTPGSRVPDAEIFPLATGPERWMASAVHFVDSPNPFAMEGGPEPKPLKPLDRALLIARRLATYAGVEHVRVTQTREAQAAWFADHRARSTTTKRVAA